MTQSKPLPLAGPRASSEAPLAAITLLMADRANLSVTIELKDEVTAAPPPQVSAAVNRVLPERSPPSGAEAGSWGVGSRAALERCDRHTEVGVEVFLLPRFTARWGGELALGLRDGLAESSENGQIETFAASDDARLVTGVRGVEWFGALGVVAEL